MLLCPLRSNVESMMIDKLIDIKALEIVQQCIECDFIRNEQVSEYGNKVCCMKDAINMDDRENWFFSGTVQIWGYHPHPCVIVWLLRNVAKPMN